MNGAGQSYDWVDLFSSDPQDDLEQQKEMHKSVPNGANARQSVADYGSKVFSNEERSETQCDDKSDSDAYRQEAARQRRLQQAARME
ncbi:hypothetical protein FRC16_000413 [Serendipita sp. 398]|nr:hypothetical protein FRC16_000413 [Serendipita sp. 398]